MRSLLSVALLFSISGCYVYVPVSDSMPKAGKEVRAHLSPQRDFDIGSVTVRDVTRLDGILYSSSSDSIAIFSEWLHQTFGRRFNSRRAVYYLSRDAIGGLEERQFHPMRSAVAVALGVTTFASVFTFIADPGGNAGDQTNEGGVASRLARPFR